MYRFGEFLLDVPGRSLQRNGEEVHLEPQAFDVLAHLVEHRDRVVPQLEILDGVWGHQFLTDASLTTRIKEIRRALGDDGRAQHTIRNVRGRGYQFVAPATVVDRERAPSTGLVGRAAELSELTDLVGRHSLVTIVGPGGVGKSTLARALAAQRRDAHIVELAPLDPGSPVLPTVARALDVVLDDDRPDEAIRSVGERDMVLVLDNCEHVVDDVAVLLDEVLRGARRNVRVVATSQVRIGLSEETLLPLAPLPPDDAVTLFEVRARASAPSWSPDGADRERIERLVSELDRLPLTIEMAAARVGSMSFDDLEQAIAAQTPLLQMTHRAPARRHRSLESVVDWSATLLEPRLREVFRAFSVFAGRVAAADAVRVVGPREPAAARFDLAALAERSLLVSDVDDGGTRYRMLTTVRSVAGRWLDEAGETDAVRARHAAHILDAVREVDDLLRTPAEPDARRRLAELTDEIRAAHRWAREHEPDLASSLSAALFHGAYSNHWNEPSEWSRALLASSDRSSPWPGAVVMACGSAANRGQLALARKQTTSVLDAVTGRLRACAFELLSDVALYEGDNDAALAASEELARLGETLDDPHARAIGAVNASLALTYKGNPDAGLRRLTRDDIPALAPTDAAWLAFARGDALGALGDPSAWPAFLDAIRLGGLAGNRFVVAVARTALAVGYARVGEVDRSLDAYAQSVDDYLRHGDYTHGVTALRNLLRLLTSIGDDRAVTILAGALSREGLRDSRGADSVGPVIEVLAERVPSAQFESWFTEGRALDVDDALRTAADVIAGHRR